jgi:GH15 family glucan-1,4-alpha-glucosidase
MADLAERDDELQIMYALDGEREIPEQELQHLSGYAGSRPVRIGNAASQQRQHDVWGALLNSIHLHYESRDALDERTWAIVRKQVEHTVEHWREPDHGLWEVRGEPKHFTSSKLFCWVACDRGARLARLREEHELAARWQSVADEIHAEICERAIDRAECSPSTTTRRRWTHHFSRCRCSASCPAVMSAFGAPSTRSRRS